MSSWLFRHTWSPKRRRNRPKLDNKEPEPDKVPDPLLVRAKWLLPKNVMDPDIPKIPQNRYTNRHQSKGNVRLKNCNTHKSTHTLAQHLQQPKVMSSRLTRGSWAASPLKSLNVWVPGGQVWHNRLWNYSIIFVHKHTQTHTHTHLRTTEGESDTREGASKEQRSKRTSRRLPVTWHPITFSHLLRQSDATEAKIKAANCHSLRRD